MNRTGKTFLGLMAFVFLIIAAFGQAFSAESPATSDASTLLSAAISSHWSFYGTAITAVVSLVASVLVYVSSMRANESKKKEIESLADSKLSELAQTQLRDILLKRIEVYPKLWSIAQTMLSDWERERKEIDSHWARNLFENLVTWHQENGIFLSQEAYITFHALRLEAQYIVTKCSEGEKPTIQDLHLLDRIYSGGELEVDQVDSKDHPGFGFWKSSTQQWIAKGGKRCGAGLATELKNDLGSYKRSALKA